MLPYKRRGDVLTMIQACVRFSVLKYRKKDNLKSAQKEMGIFPAIQHAALTGLTVDKGFCSLQGMVIYSQVHLQVLKSSSL